MLKVTAFYMGDTEEASGRFAKFYLPAIRSFTA